VEQTREPMDKLRRLLRKGPNRARRTATLNSAARLPPSRRLHLRVRPPTPQGSACRRQALSFRARPANFFIPSSFPRRSWAANLSSIDRASHVGSSLALRNHTNRSLGAPPFQPILPQLFLQTTPAQTPLRFPRLQCRHRTVRQFQAPAIPFRITTHGCIATRTPRFHSIILSCPLGFIDPAAIKNSQLISPPG